MNDVGTEHFRTAEGNFCVRVMAAYGAEGVWNAEGLEGLVGDLPIDPDLADRLADWQEAFDDLDDRTDEAAGDLDAALRSAWNDLAEEGLSIARAIKRALPDWTVLHVDPALAREIANAAATEISG